MLAPLTLAVLLASLVTDVVVLEAFRLMEFVAAFVA